MTDRAGGAEATDIALDASLLDAKLSIPGARTGIVSRRALIASSQESGRRVVGITAPAGYGKSTLLAEWAGSERRRVAWLSLDRFDDDPMLLLSLIASAFTVATGTSASLVADMSGLRTSVLGRTAPRLAAAFRSSEQPFVLMLDDLHEIRKAACHDALSIVISGIPAGSQLVAASRAELPDMPRLRAAGDSLELGMADLALDVSGTEQVFSTSNVNVTPELAAIVTERTEGWPAGVYLASMIARDGKGDSLTISGDDRYVADYLYRESFVYLPEDEKAFLRRTAVLDQLSGPLCDAVLESSDAQLRLEGMEAASQFLIALDRRREWYRYHALFREFLLAELRRVEPDEVGKLHLRAADWYEANGSPAMAVEHLLRTAEEDRCLKLVTQLVLPTFEAGRVSSIQQWLDALGDRAIESYPPLAVDAAWTAIYSGQTTEGQRWAAFVEDASFDLAMVDGSASFESARGMLRAAMCPRGPEEMLADATVAMDQEPPWSPWRDAAIVLCAEAELLCGRADRADELFAEAVALASPFSNADRIVVGSAELALVAMDGSHWAEASDHVDRALAAVEDNRMHDYPTAILAFAAAARLALHHGDRKQTDRHLAAAMRGRPVLTFLLPIWAVRARLTLSRVHWALAEHETARHLLREIDDVLVQRPALGVLVDEVAELRELVSSTVTLRAGQPSPLSAAELRLLPYLQTHLLMREIAERLFVSRNTVSSQVNSIYRKLGVSSRNDAVEKAMAVGLLGD